MKKRIIYICIAFLLCVMSAGSVFSLDKEKAKKKSAQYISKYAKVENDIISFGLFPNSEGFLDGKLYLRGRYWETFSSGIYIDYTTKKTSSEKASLYEAYKEETLTKEYRVDSDLFKGIWLVANSKSFMLSIEPGANFKYVYQDIEASGYRRNPDNSIVFHNDEIAYMYMGGAAKLEISMKIGSMFALDFSGEYIPYIYNKRDSKIMTSQFPDKPIETNLTNSTWGYQANLAVKADLGSIGAVSFKGRLFKNEGKISSKAIVVNGNYETTIETFEKYHETLYWFELYYDMKFLVKFTGGFVPVMSFAMERHETKIASQTSSSNVFKIGFLLNR